MNSMETDGLVTLEECAKYAHVSRQAVAYALRKKRIKAVKKDRKWYIKKEDYDTFRLNRASRNDVVKDGKRVFDPNLGNYSVEQVTSIINMETNRSISIQYIYRMLWSGKLKATRNEWSWVIHKDEINRLINHIKSRASSKYLNFR
jgi:hypothetical protein